jgi:hypothetical protein
MRRVAERTRIRAGSARHAVAQSFPGVLRVSRRDRTCWTIGPRRRKSMEGVIAQARAGDRLKAAMRFKGLRASTVRDQRPRPVDHDSRRTSLQRRTRMQPSRIFRVAVASTARDLVPLAPRRGSIRFAARALRNAFQSLAGETDRRWRSDYEERVFQLRIRDDGKGIEPKLITENRTRRTLRLARHARTRQAGRRQAGRFEWVDSVRRSNDHSRCVCIREGVRTPRWRSESLVDVRR